MRALLDEIPRVQPTRMVTRFELRDVAAGVSDLAAMRLVLDRGGRVRGIRALHSKVYVFGTSHAVVTSANLTARGLNGNEEFGCVSDDETFITSCAAYADQLWSAAKTDLTYDRLDDWEQRVVAARLAGATVTAIDELPDFGAAMPGQELDEPQAAHGDPAPIDWPTDGQAFIKLFGEGDDLVSPDMLVYDELVEARSFAWCTYPPSKRPRHPQDGDTMFLSRLTTDGLRIFGRVLVLEHDEARDVATANDIALRGWLARFPMYVRVFRVEALAGSLRNGFLVNELTTVMGTDSFRTTQQRALRGEANINPNLSLRQQAHVRLTTEAASWCHRRLQKAFELHGRLPDETLEALRSSDPMAG